MIIARRLHQYFQAHTITVRTNPPILKILQKPDLVGRMVAWSVELSEFDIRYELRMTIRAQALVDILVEMVEDEEPPEPRWTLHVDGASSSKGSGARVILEKEEEIIFELSIKLNFPISNNQAEYKAPIAELQLANDLDTTCFTICSDS